MKKISLLLIIACLLLVGCGNGKSAAVSGDNSPTGTAGTPQSTEVKGYFFDNNGVIIPMNAKAAPILESLGKEKEYFEAPSCAFQGMDKTYTYNGFELHTYELDKVDYVASIFFLDDSVSTKEGIFLNADLADVIKAYGDKYTKNVNLYTYQLDESRLSFMIENDKVISIEYMAVTE